MRPALAAAAMAVERAVLAAEGDREARIEAGLTAGLSVLHPTALAREPRDFEQHIDTDHLGGLLDEARDSLAIAGRGAAADLRDLVVKAALAGGDRPELPDALVSAIAAELARIAQEGRLSVRREIGRQRGQSETTLNWVEDVGGLPHKIKKLARKLREERGMAEQRSYATAVSAAKRFCAKGHGDWCAAVAEWEEKRAKARTLDDEDDDSLIERARLAAENVLGSMWSAAKRLTFGESPQERIDREVDEAAEAQLRREALLNASAALNTGREAEAQDHADEIVGVRYSAVLDKNTCSPCQEADDGKLRALDDPIRLARRPPNKECHGRDRCRCIEFYELVDPGTMTLATSWDPSEHPRDADGRFRIVLTGVALAAVKEVLDELPAYEMRSARGAIKRATTKKAGKGESVTVHVSKQGAQELHGLAWIADGSKYGTNSATEKKGLNWLKDDASGVAKLAKSAQPTKTELEPTQPGKTPRFFETTTRAIQGAKELPHPTTSEWVTENQDQADLWMDALDRLERPVANEEAAIESYTDGGYREMNQYLRESGGLSDPEIRERVRDLMDVIRRTEVDKGSILFREVKGRTGERWKLAKVGDVLGDSAFSSASVNLAYATSLSATGSGMNVMIRVPPGARGLSINAHGTTEYPDEEEVVLPPGSYRVAEVIQIGQAIKPTLILDLMMQSDEEGELLWEMGSD